MAAWQAIQKFSRFEKAANLSLWNIHAFSSKGQMRTLAHNLLREYVSSVGLDSDRRWMKKLNVQMTCKVKLSVNHELVWYGD